MTPLQQTKLFQLRSEKKEFDLHTIKKLLARLGDPQLHPKIIHIAGTNGKGSTLIVLESLLLRSGFSVGSTVSPHLVKFNERFRINGIEAGSEQVASAFERVRMACGLNEDLVPEKGSPNTLSPSFFEYSLAMAFLIFADQPLDYWILETGLGGRLDATNVIEKPLACVISRIAKDHIEYLGESLEAIAVEKLGIVKPETKLFIARQEEDLLRFMVDEGQKRAAETFYHPKHSRFEETEGNTLFQIGTKDQVKMEILVRDHEIGLLGRHQKENILNALSVYWKIMDAGKRLTAEEIISVMGRLSWMGRMEYLTDHLLLDGAHNASGMKNLVRYLSERHPDQKILIALCWRREKDLLEGLKDLSLKNVEFLPVETSIEGAASTREVLARLFELGISPLPSMKTQQLVQMVRESQADKWDLVVVTGSLYLLGEFYVFWQTDALETGPDLSVVARAAGI